jgi:hypothetical protein
VVIILTMRGRERERFRMLVNHVDRQEMGIIDIQCSVTFVNVHVVFI